MIGEQDEDSCGKSGTGETPQEHTRRGGSPAARGKRSLARKSIAVHFVMSQSCFTYLSSVI
ncbi:hypothetical protein V7094_00915 [Priestia megaterium]|uniref:hypothetical protein n=1 Tax=Priestia TaxID=2800373 RepID=UPI000BF6C734|nr:MULTISPECIES: hypothetical protein [Priestia]RFB26242.1 hypothetical protein DZB87_19310 [Bacillus sp. ALD]MBM6599892.1 hypothetical protein [Priestia megaterium]MCA4152785.1 hypothetical protein [Priestia megaterium]MCR8862602.1 hypothetical protein [Priestia megaterium]MDP1438506.1 hypothetical protein [Priestia megaterium]